MKRDPTRPWFFVAVDVPDEVRDALARVQEVQEDIEGVRWVAPQKMHVTLRFLGPLEDDRAEAVRGAVEAVRAAPFDLTARGVGTFGRDAPRVLWAGLEPAGDEAPLVRVRAQLERLLAGAGVEPDPRPFSAHLTLGRGRAKGADARARLKRDVAAWTRRHADLAVGPWTVSELLLLTSVQAAGGREYRVDRRVPLA